jgi:hypothetical protein
MMNLPDMFPLADAAVKAAADPLDKILPWITTFVAMVLAAVFKVQADRARALRLEEPVPTVPTRKVAGFVTWDSLQPIVTRMDRLERHLDEVRREQSDQFKEILEAGSQRADNLRTHLDDVARAIHSRIDDIHRDGNGPKPRTGR